MTRRAAAIAALFPAMLAAGLSADAAGAGRKAGAAALEARTAQRARDLAEAEGRADAARLEADALAAQLDAAGGGKVSDRSLRLAGLAAERRTLDARLGAERARMARLLGALELFRRDPPPALLVRPDDVLGAVRAAILIRAVAPEIEARADGLKQETERIEALRRAADAGAAGGGLSGADLAARRVALAADLARAEAVARRADADADAASNDVEQLSARARAMRALAQGVSAGPTAGGPTPPDDPDHAGPGGGAMAFARPVSGPLRSGFGARDPASGDASDGVAFRAPRGGDVVAPAGGAVEYAGPLKGWGLVLILRLGGGYHVVLAGLDTVRTAPGRSVARGEIVGRMASGGDTEPDLYLEVRKDGAPVDPARWLKAASPGGR